MRTVSRAARLAAAVGALVVVGVSMALLAVTGAAAAAAAPCPRGYTHVDLVHLEHPIDLECGDLRGLDLSGMSLIQATLDHADLEGADLSDAKLDQASLIDANLRGANLSHVDLTQADLTDADLTGATLTGADITQTTLTGTTLDQVKGLRSYGRYVSALGGVVFVAMAMLTIAKASRRRRANLAAASDHGETPLVPASYAPTANPSGSTTSQLPPPPSAADAPFGAFAPASSLRSARRTLVVGLLGALVAGFGVQAFVGGLLKTFSPAFDPLLNICQQSTCQANIEMGVLAVFAGFPLALLGLAVWGKS